MSISVLGNTYTVRRTFTNPGAITLLQVAANAARPVVPLRAWVSQHAGTASTQIAAGLVKKTAAATVTAATAADFEKHLGVAANATFQLGTALSGHTATAEGTDGDVFNDEGLNVVGGGWVYLPLPEERVCIPAGGIFGLKLFVAPPAGTYRAGLVLLEIG
jgi:hypothetical protein